MRIKVRCFEEKKAALREGWEFFDEAEQVRRTDQIKAEATAIFGPLEERDMRSLDQEIQVRGGDPWEVVDEFFRPILDNFFDNPDADAEDMKGPDASVTVSAVEYVFHRKGALRTATDLLGYWIMFAKRDRLMMCHTGESWLTRSPDEAAEGTIVYDFRTRKRTAKAL